MKKFKAFRVVFLLFIILTGLSVAAAWAVPHFGFEFGLEGIPGAMYRATVVSGHYFSGVHIPAGEYTLTVKEGSGSVIYPGDDGVRTTADMETGDEAVQFTLGKEDYITVIGLTVALRCSNGSGHYPSSYENGTGTGEVFTAEDAGEDGYDAGRDFPAGTYHIRAVTGVGKVSGGSSAGGIDLDMDSTGIVGVKEFKNVLLSEDTALMLSGVDVELIPVDV